MLNGKPKVQMEHISMKKKRRGKCDVNCEDCPEPCQECPDCNCPECPKCPGGIGDRCENDDCCAKGLKCVDDVCVCVKPEAPMLTNLVTAAGITTISWTAVPGATSYHIFVNGPDPQTVLFYNDTTIEFNLLLGMYEVKIYAVSDDCGEGPPLMAEFLTDMCVSDQQCPPMFPTCTGGGVCCDLRIPEVTSVIGLAEDPFTIQGEFSFTQMITGLQFQVRLKNQGGGTLYTSAPANVVQIGPNLGAFELVNSDIGDILEFQETYLVCVALLTPCGDTDFSIAVPVTICIVNNVCIECIDNGDCTGLEQCVNNVCVPPECVIDDDCPMERPRCNVDNTCVECIDNADCPSNSCTDNVCDCIAAVTPNVTNMQVVPQVGQQSININWPLDPIATMSIVTVSFNPDMSAPIGTFPIGAGTNSLILSPQALGLGQSGSSSPPLSINVPEQYFTGETFYVQIEQQAGPGCSVLGGIGSTTFNCGSAPIPIGFAAQQRAPGVRIWDFFFAVAPFGGAAFEIQIFGSRVPNFDPRTAEYTVFFPNAQGIPPGLFGTGPFGFFWESVAGTPSFNMVPPNLPSPGETVYFYAAVKPFGSNSCWSGLSNIAAALTS